MDGTTRRVLVVDDDPALLRLLGDFLRTRGYLADAVSTGRGALERLRQQRYDLLLLDLSLPDVSGFEIVETLAPPPGAPPPAVLVISARSSPIDRAQALEVGASDYLVKPFTLAELAERVAALLAARPKQHFPTDQLQAL